MAALVPLSGSSHRLPQRYARGKQEGRDDRADDRRRQRRAHPGPADGRDEFPPGQSPDTAAGDDGNEAGNDFHGAAGKRSEDGFPSI